MLAVLLPAGARIDRRAVVARHNPHVTKVDTLASLTVGNGRFAATVDATGLQTFPELYSNGIPLTTMSAWGWHYSPNPDGLRPSQTLAPRDFGRQHGSELYALQTGGGAQQAAAADYFRANPHRLNLACIGLNISNPSLVDSVDEHLDMWTGKVDSRFKYGSNHLHVETVCDYSNDLLASRVSGDMSGVGIRIRVPWPTAQHADDASDWKNAGKVRISGIQDIYGQGTAQFLVVIGSTRYVMQLAWTGRAELSSRGQTILLTSHGTQLDFYCRFLPFADDNDTIGAFYPVPFSDIAMSSAGHWADWWSRGGFVDFSGTADARAAELERRVILSQYLMGTQEDNSMPPQETGLTYNSWFGKFHLEMVWWHQAWLGLWGYDDVLDRTLDWYHTALPKARAIARRQHFAGCRWMKMTDPTAVEAPSNVGSLLIWQQPHPIYLAELLYRAVATPGDSSRGDSIPSYRQQQVLRKYADIVELTAEFMADFAEYDSVHSRYVLRGCIPAQETLKADSMLNPPLELAEWLEALKIARQWRVRMGARTVAKWDDIISRLSPLKAGSNGLYLAAEPAADTYTDIRLTSDHPAVLGAFGMMPQSRLVDNAVMRRTLSWIQHNWHWNTAWGWDFPMMAMTCARLGMPSDAVDALLMNEPKNTYLSNGHNWQSNRLRAYLPGNGGLLMAVGMMAAGWDGSAGRCPGFPSDWHVQYEGILPMP